MEITWKRTMPTWAAIVCAVFGLANVVGALWSGRPDFTVPGVVIGLIWFVIGAMGGLPIVGSTSVDMLGTPAGIAKGIAAIWRRRVAAFAAPFVMLPIIVLVLPRTAVTRIPSVVLGIGMLGAVPVLLLALTGCPRCGERFLRGPRVSSFPPDWRCQNCGLSLKDPVSP